MNAAALGITALVVAVSLGGCGSQVSAPSLAPTATPSAGSAATRAIPTATPLATLPTATWAVACGTVRDYVGNTSTTDGSFVLDSPGRSPLRIALTSAHSTPGGSFSGYLCASLEAGVPSPIFGGIWPPNTAGFINPGVLPATAAQPAPTGFVLPQACAFVAPPMVGTDQTMWSVDCAANNNNARGTLGPALSQQGWTSCGAGLASAQWRKNNVMLGITESSLAPGDYPRLTQLTRVLSPCS